METPSIREFFSYKNVFITGGSGFIGKVLIEKLLRSVPELGNVYVLLRPKKGKSLEDRIKIITELPLFDLLRSQNPSALKKIKPIKGDVCEIGLELSEEDEETLINEVDIIFHGAASVRFDDALSDAIILNTRGTREVVLLAQKMEHLLTMVHISTAYCHTERDVIDECLYPTHVDWRDAIQLAETLESHTLDVMCAKYIDKQPNTYTFTKSLSEHVADDLCKEKEIPLVIVRPSIVTSTLKEPMGGWIDNFNGPIGLMIGASSGVLRSWHCRTDAKSDYWPVDLIVKIILCATWAKSTEKNPVKKLETSVYNATSRNIFLSVRDVVDMSMRLRETHNVHQMIWYPDGKVTTCRYNYFLRIIFYQILPALVVDGLLRTIKMQPMLLTLQRRMYAANMALGYFTSYEWKFLNSNAQQLYLKIKNEDVKDFGNYVEPINIFEYFEICVTGGKKYLLKEHLDDHEKAQRKISIMHRLYQIWNVVWYIGLFYILIFKVDVLGWLLEFIVDVYGYFITDD